MDSQSRLLAQAVLYEDPAGLEAYRSWRAAADLDRLPGEENALLPLLYYRLADLQTDDPWLGRLKGIYRRTWYANQLALNALADLAAALDGLQIPFLLTGSAFLVQEFYPDRGTRPIRTLEMVVPAELAGRASEGAVQLGWRPVRRLGRSPGFQRGGQPVESWFVNAPGLHFQLRTHVLDQIPVAAVDQQGWGQARPWTAGGSAALAMAPANCLLAACLDLYRLGALALVDCALIVNSGKVDWDALLENVIRFRVETPVAYALEFVLESGCVAIPKDCLSRLRQRKPGLLEGWIHQFGLVPPSQRSVIHRLLLRSLQKVRVI